MKERKKEYMDTLEMAVERIRNCSYCDGRGTHYWGNGEDYDFENCECNPHEIIFDYDGEVIWADKSLEKTIWETAEAN